MAASTETAAHVRYPSGGVNDDAGGEGERTTLSRKQHFPAIAAALDCFQSNRSEQHRAAFNCRAPQPSFES
jgi:hypothetical protein